MGKTAMIFAICLVAWFAYFQVIDWIFMNIQGLDYCAGIDFCAGWAAKG